jgi:hypothetical protein
MAEYFMKKQEPQGVVESIVVVLYQGNAYTGQCIKEHVKTGNVSHSLYNTGTALLHRSSIQYRVPHLRVQCTYTVHSPIYMK